MLCAGSVRQKNVKNIMLKNMLDACGGGLVGITAGCSVVTPWSSGVIGLVSGWVYVAASNLLVKLKIDDAVDSIPVHFFCGIWGCICRRFWDIKDVSNFLLLNLSLQLSISCLNTVLIIIIVRLFST